MLGTIRVWGFERIDHKFLVGKFASRKISIRESVQTLACRLVAKERTYVLAAIMGAPVAVHYLTIAPGAADRAINVSIRVATRSMLGAIFPLARVRVSIGIYISSFAFSLVVNPVTSVFSFVRGNESAETLLLVCHVFSGILGTRSKSVLTMPVFLPITELPDIRIVVGIFR